MGPRAPSSLITKVPSAAVGVTGIASELSKNKRPFDKAHATLFRATMFNKDSTETFGSFSKA